MEDVDPRCDFRDLRAAPRIPVVWSASRDVLNRVLFGLARAVSPSPYWVEFRGRQGEPDPPGPADLRWVEPDHLFNIGSLFETPSKDAPPTVEFALISFLRDPSAEPIAQTMRLTPVTRPLGTTPEASGPLSVVAVANVDRIDQLYPETPRAMQAVVRAFLRAGVVPFFSTLRPTKRRAAADFVFQVAAPGLGEWKTGTLTCEKAPEGLSWRTGDSLPLTRFSTVSAALSGKIDDLAG